jgi:hypothetical protein
MPWIALSVTPGKKSIGTSDPADHGDASRPRLAKALPHDRQPHAAGRRPGGQGVREPEALSCRAVRAVGVGDFELETWARLQTLVLRTSERHFEVKTSRDFGMPD